jgi:hypothetical protein
MTTPPHWPVASLEPPRTCSHPCYANSRWFQSQDQGAGREASRDVVACLNVRLLGGLEGEDGNPSGEDVGRGVQLPLSSATTCRNKLMDSPNQRRKPVSG